MTKPVWEPHAGPQTDLIRCPIFEVFYGGARGGGKSEGILGDWLAHCEIYKQDAIGIVFRRELVQLVELIERSKVIYNQFGATFHEQSKTWTMHNGSRLRFAYLDRDSDADSYQGHSYTRVYVEEIGTFPNRAPINRLMATLRSGQGVPCGLRATGNPGGPGHHHTKQRYIDPAPQGYVIIEEEYKNPNTKEVITRQRVFIPSKVADNPSLGPEYVANLQMSGSEQLVKAWLDGDWSVIDGAFFDQWSMGKHVLRPFSIPGDWLRFRSMDWGYATPFSVGWWALVQDDYVGENIYGSKILLPRGALVRYREWYGSKRSDNAGLRLEAEEVAEGIRERERSEEVSYGVLDPSAFNRTTGPSIAERMHSKGVSFRRADNTRIAKKGALSGWDALRSRIRGIEGEYPMIYCFETCYDSIRTVPLLQHDRDNPEDADTEGEDHCFTEDTLVRTLKGVYSFAELMGTEGFTRCHDGQWHSFRSVRLVKCNQPIVALTFSDGVVIRCTPDHRFLTMKGWMEAKDMMGMTTLSLSPAPVSGFGERTIGSAAVGTTVGSENYCTVLSGKPIGEKFPKVGISITRTGTAIITQLKIWIACLLGFINQMCMVKNTGLVGDYISNERQHRLESGTILRLAEHGIESIFMSIVSQPSMPNERLSASTVARSTNLTNTMASFAQTSVNRRGDGLLALMMRSDDASSVMMNSPSTGMQRSGLVREPADLYPVLKTGPECLSLSDAGRSDVYCFTVPDTGNFELANGMVASQCPDDWRYAAMSRPWFPGDSPKEDKKLEYHIGPDGSVSMNMSVMDIIKDKQRKRLFA